MKMLAYAELKSGKGIRYSNVHLRRLEATGEFPRRAITALASNGLCALA